MRSRCVAARRPEATLPGSAALRDERGDGFALTLEEAEDEKRARARGGRLGGGARPVRVAQPLEQRNEERRERPPVRRVGQALEHPTERLLRLLVEDRPQGLPEGIAVRRRQSVVEG